MSPVADQLGLSIIPSPTPPNPTITIATTSNTPISSTVFDGETIVLGAWVANNNPNQVSCQVEFYLQDPNYHTCEPVSIISDVSNQYNPTPAATLNQGAQAFFTFSWIVNQPPCRTTFFAQVRATDQPASGLGLPCTGDPWNARRGCTISPAQMAEDRAYRETAQSPSSANLYRAFALVNQDTEDVQSKFSVAALSQDDQWDDPAVRAEVDWLRKQGFAFAEPSRLTHFLGKERVVRTERSDRVRLGRVGALDQRQFEQLREGDPLEGESKLPLLAGEVRQIVLHLRRSLDIERREFYLIRVRHEIGDKVSERLRVFRSHGDPPPLFDATR